MESLSDIEAELRDLSKEELRRTAMRVNVCEPQPTVCGKPICAYFAEIADRIKETAWHDERLMLSLMLYAVEDYVEDWASEKFKKCVRAACERLGLEYRPNASCLQEQIADRITAMDGEPRVMCKLSPDRPCVDCEMCRGEEGGDGE